MATVDIEKTDSIKENRLIKVLYGTKCTLIPFKEEHICECYINWLNDSEVNRFLEVRHNHQTYDSVLTFVRSFYGDDEKYMWGIYSNDPHKLIGTTTLHSIDRNHNCGEIGLLIGEKVYWGKGASTEVIELLLEFAFEILKLHRLTGGTYAPNRGMNFTFKTLGFAREGVLRKALAITPGEYVDGYRWGVLADEWRTLNKRV